MAEVWVRLPLDAFQTEQLDRVERRVRSGDDFTSVIVEWP
jgi:hypothetical protein